MGGSRALDVRVDQVSVAPALDELHERTAPGTLLRCSHPFGCD